MGQIGEQLKNTRESKSLTLKQVEESTRIRLKYLEALEAENFSIMPGRVYVIGFIRTYARYLGLDEELLVKHYKDQEEYNIIDEPVKIETTPRKLSTKPLGIALGLGVVLLIIWFGYVVAVKKGASPISEKPQPSIPDNVYQTPENVSEPDPQIDTSEPEPTENPGEPLSPVNVTVNIRNYNCWVNVTIDGTEFFKGILNPGDSRVFSGNSSIIIRFGNAAAAEVIYKGETTYPLGQYKQVITQEFTAE